MDRNTIFSNGPFSRMVCCVTHRDHKLGGAKHGGKGFFILKDFPRLENNKVNKERGVGRFGERVQIEELQGMVKTYNGLVGIRWSDRTLFSEHSGHIKSSR